MAGKMQIVVFLAAMAAVVGICSAATTHIVGDSSGWTIPTTQNLYTSWASNNKVQVGDTLVFKFATGMHTVAEVSKSDYDSCSAASPMSAVLSTAPANITIKSPGPHYYICTVTGHCSAGQKLSIVAASSSTPAAAAPKTSKKKGSASAPAQAPAPVATTTTPTAAVPAGAPTDTTVPTVTSAGAPASPPGANFAAPREVGFGVVGVFSVVAAALLI